MKVIEVVEVRSAESEKTYGNAQHRNLTEEML
jgi:hypothetical protein